MRRDTQGVDTVEAREDEREYDVTKDVSGWTDVAAFEPPDPEFLYERVTARTKEQAKIMAVKQWLKEGKIERADGNPFTGVKVERVPEDHELCPVCNPPGMGDCYDPMPGHCTYCNDTGLRPGVKL